ncbi:MAG: DNA polymerase III subunit alpha [Bacteroidia bacterium]
MFLNCHSWFSLNYGTLSVEALLKEAVRCGVPKLALTDINNTSGVSDFLRLAPSYGVKAVAGIEFRTGAYHHYTGIAKTGEGFRSLNEFLTGALRTGTDREPEFPDTPPPLRDVYWIIPYSPEMKTDPEVIRRHPDYFLGIRRSQLNRLRFSEWSRVKKKLLAFHPVTYKNAGGYTLHHLLRAVDKNTLLSRLDAAEIAGNDETFLTPSEIAKSFSDFSFLAEQADAILSECETDLGFHQSKNKETFFGSIALDVEVLRRETFEGMRYRYGEGDAVAIERAEKELRMIAELGFAAYFLINWDIIRYARHRNYSYVGRGSGANSIVAYCLGITDVDPVELDLYFERFINPSRTNPPDFDIDFSWTDRDDVIDYIFHCYGQDHVALLGAYSTYQSNAVVRELGKVYGLPKGEIDSIVENRRHPDTPDKIVQTINYFAAQLQDFPNHLTIHACGMLVSEKPITYYTSTFMPPKGFPTTQFSMLEAEDLGFCKLDILSQRGLGHIKDTVDIVLANRGEAIDIHAVSEFKKDEKIKDLIRTGRCMGCFYVESPAMRMLLKKLAVDTYIQLVAASSIIRPGVARSGMMREYILRTHDPSRRQYIHPLMKELMEETYGIMVYQEDVIKVAYHFAGLSLSEADSLRRGMSGKFRSREEFARIRGKFFSNCKERGYPDEITTEVWRQIESFAGYSFSKGHSASYAVESFQSLFLKAHYPKEFMVGVINNFGGFYRTEFYVHEARMSGATVHAPDINRSQYKTAIYGDDIFLGFIHLAGMEEKVAKSFLREREVNGPFQSLPDFMKRVSIEIEQLRILIRIGAFRFTGRTKKQLLWDVHMEIGSERKTEKRQALFETTTQVFTLPELVHHAIDDAHDEIELLGFPLCSPFSLLPDESIVKLNAADLAANVGKRIEIVGYMVTCKYTSTIKREMMMFGTFLDSKGYFFDTTHFPKVADQYPFRGRGLYRIRGKVDREFGFCCITVEGMEKMGVN